VPAAVPAHPARIEGEQSGPIRPVPETVCQRTDKCLKTDRRPRPFRSAFLIHHSSFIVASRRSSSGLLVDGSHRPNCRPCFRYNSGPSHGTGIGAGCGVGNEHNHGADHGRGNGHRNRYRNGRNRGQGCGSCRGSNRGRENGQECGQDREARNGTSCSARTRSSIGHNHGTSTRTNHGSDAVSNNLSRRGANDGGGDTLQNVVSCLAD